MFDNAVSALPIPLAIRLALDSVSYSNPLPEWYETLDRDYIKKEETIHEKIKQYIKGVPPKTPFEVRLPNKAGNMKRWAIPSINDQIICQACVSSIAETLDQKAIDHQRVFSCWLSTDPSRLALMEDQIASWKKFQNETRQRCTSDGCLLQIDLADAYGNIDRKQFVDFLRGMSSGGIEIDLLEILLDTFSSGAKGLPLVNDSIFYLGNAYLSVVDKTVGYETSNFIRFVDDYRIFGNSRSELETLLQRIGARLGQLGFQINHNKLKLGSNEEYLEAISTVRYADRKRKGEHRAVSEDDSGYSDPAILSDVIDPEIMIDQISKTLDHPEQYLHQGFGRFQTGSLRRLRVDGLISELKDKELNKNPQRTCFSRLLSDNDHVLRKISMLLKSFSRDPDQEWRTIWLLYLTKDIQFDWINDKKLSIDLEETLNRIRSSASISQAAKFWAAEMKGFPNIPDRAKTFFDIIDDSNYIERGKLCYGD